MRRLAAGLGLLTALVVLGITACDGATANVSARLAGVPDVWVDSARGIACYRAYTGTESALACATIGQPVRP